MCCFAICGHEISNNNCQETLAKTSLPWFVSCPSSQGPRTDIACCNTFRSQRGILNMGQGRMCSETPAKATKQGWGKHRLCAMTLIRSQARGLNALLADRSPPACPREPSPLSAWQIHLQCQSSWDALPHSPQHMTVVMSQLVKT